MNQDWDSIINQLAGVRSADSVIQQQLARAQAARGQRRKEYQTAGGALFGGLGHIIGQGAAAFEESDAQGKQKQNEALGTRLRQALGANLSGQGPSADQMQQLSTADEAELGQQLLAATESLKRLRQAGTAALMSGDEAAAKLGQEQLARADKMETQLAQLPGQRLQMALSKNQLAQSNAELADANGPVMPVYREMARGFGFDLPEDMTNRQMQSFMDMALKKHSADMRARELQLNRQAMLQNRSDARADKDEDRLLGRTEKLAKATADSVPVVASLKRISSLLGPEGFASKEDIPGIGRGQGLLIGPLSLLRSDKGKEMRAAASDLAANVLRAYSGAAASDREMARTLERLGQGDFSSDAEFLDALKRARAFASLQMKQSEAGLGTEAAERLRQEGGVTSRDVDSIGGTSAGGAGGLTPDKKARLEELRRKKAAGQLQ